MFILMYISRLTPMMTMMTAITLCCNYQKGAEQELWLGEKNAVSPGIDFCYTWENMRAVGNIAVIAPTACSCHMEEIWQLLEILLSLLLQHAVATWESVWGWEAMAFCPEEAITEKAVGILQDKTLIQLIVWE